jgi:hypothetical protein
MLNSVLDQSGLNKGRVTSGNWQALIAQRLTQLDWDRVMEDVQRFLIMQEALIEFKKEKIENLLT